MKRSEISNEVKNEKVYEINIKEVFKVTFLKPHASFKAGDVTYLGLPVAVKFANAGLISATSDMKAALKKYKAEELLTAKS